MESNLEKLDLKSELIRQLIDNTPVAYIILDDEFRIHFINDNFMKLRNLKRETTIGEKCYNISNGGKKCSMCAVEQALETKTKSFISRKDILPNGAVRFIDDYAIPLRSNSADDTPYVLEIMVNRTQEMLARERRDADYDEILSIFSTLLEAKDKYTADHSDSVRKISTMLAKAMGLSAKDVFEISIGASLHDMGKVAISDAIINKAGKLDDNEFNLIKSHPVKSHEMLRDLSCFENVKNIAKYHHERVDGKGYPENLTGDDIPLGARIVAIADTYDAITSTRSYRKALTHEYALEEIKRVAGTQLDADIVEIFINMSFSDDVQQTNNDESPEKPHERAIQAQSVVEQKEIEQASDFKTLVDESALISDIFDNTPCGYVLMDTDRKVLFASKYFLEYMGLTEGDVYGKKCYQVGAKDNKPCSVCAIEMAMKSGNVEFARQEKNTNNGTKIFDSFGMPIKNADGKIEQVIEVIIDRTEEILLERMRQQDFRNLIDMMTGLLKKQDVQLDKEGLPEQIASLGERLNELIEIVTSQAIA